MHTLLWRESESTKAESERVKEIYYTNRDSKRQRERDYTNRESKRQRERDYIPSHSPVIQSISG
jgi:hypothetical protein